MTPNRTIHPSGKLVGECFNRATMPNPTLQATGRMKPRPLPELSC